MLGQVRPYTVVFTSLFLTNKSQLPRSALWCPEQSLRSGFMLADGAAIAPSCTSCRSASLACVAKSSSMLKQVQLCTPYLHTLQELLGVQPKWFDAGAKDYGFPPLALLSLEFLLLGFLELKRYQGFKKTGKVTAPAVI